MQEFLPLNNVGLPCSSYNEKKFFHYSCLSYSPNFDIPTLKCAKFVWDDGYVLIDRVYCLDFGVTETETVNFNSKDWN